MISDHEVEVAKNTYLDLARRRRDELDRELNEMSRQDNGYGNNAQASTTSPGISYW